LHAQQKDTIVIKNDSILLKQQPASATKAHPAKGFRCQKKHDPHKATLYSAILPGAGQVTIKVMSCRSYTAIGMHTPLLQ
jgi:hypothetical protein